MRPTDLAAGDAPAADWVIERGDPSEIDRLEPLWQALREHHKDVYRHLPPRSPEDSWRRRRAEYAGWLGGEGFFFVARRGDELLGYVMVELSAGSPMWDMGEHAAEIQTLIVLPGERRRRLGSALLDAVDRELERLGIEHLLVEVQAGHDEALRFYERRGYRPYTAMLHRGRRPRQTEDDGDG